MAIISNINIGTHKDALLALSNKADELLIASPFCFLDFKTFANQLASIGTIRRIVFITTLKRDGVIGKIDPLLSFRDEMDRIGVEWEIRLDEQLHGKIYIFKKDGHPFAGIITSANLTENGMIKNHEYGCQIEDVAEILALEQQLLTDAPKLLSSAMLEEIKHRAKQKYPAGIKKEPVAKVDIDDILYSYEVSDGTRIFIKPVGVSYNPIYEGDYSKETNMYFSKKRPNAVRIGDILIAYAVGGRKIMGAYKVTSEPLWDEDGDSRWPWYVESDCLTPRLANCKWAQMGFHVTGIAREYVEIYNKPISHTGSQNLNAINIGWDRVQLADEYGRYLIGKIMDLEHSLEYGKQE